MRLSTGSTLGPYEITGPVGAGGMGEVYRARDTRLGREVAVKVLPHDVADNPERLARFEREARSASALNHPAIITIHEFASADGHAYLVMELVRGESLRDVLARGALPPRKLFPIAAAVADGLAAAHAGGIVHRDLKPENVMITGDGAPKIVDFGLVKGGSAPADLSHSATKLQVSEAGVVFGTASYMSPEQARGEPVDFRSDQFALGLILWEMATGRHPFQRGTTLETLASILNDDPEPLSDSLPEPFVWIVERCLAKRPSDRYGSTADLARDLARLRDRPSGARPVTQRRRVAWRWWLGAGGAALLGAVLVMTTMWPRSPTLVGDALQVSVSMPEIADVFIGEVAQPVAISPDGRYLAIYGADAHGTNHLWLHDLRSATTRLLAENAFAAAWSTDSRAIAYFAEGKLKTISVEGGPPQIVCDARPESTPSWHGDTILFAQYSRAPGIYRVSARGGQAELIVGPEKDNPDFAWWPQFLPDGKRFLFLALRQPNAERPEITHELFAGSLDGAAPQSIAAIDSRAVFANGHLLFVREGTLLARPFDPDTLQFTGEAVSLVEGLHYFRSTGLAAFSVSANGVLAWRAARAPSRLVWFDRNGMEVGSIGTLLSEGGRLSRDGKRLALGLVDPKQGVSDIWIQDLSRESPDRMTFQLLDEKHPVWAPDGTIYYRSDGGGGPPDIFKLTPGQGREVVYPGRGVNEPHDVSPDGRWLLLIDYTPPVGADISVLPLAPKGPPRPFAATPFQELSPRFSPDGRWVAYSSDISGRPEVYVRAFEGSATPVRVSQSGGTRPRWNPNGKELLFLGPGGRLMVVPVTSGFGVPRVLFQVADAADFEVNADGTRFLVHLPERREPVHLLVNWRGRLPAQR
jgi:Tol biopolymer transport system component/tRNA A-37 threonylcarbamoyl transferase component Bud32